MSIELKKIPVQDFLKMSASVPVVDVRSPAEFTSGHIPGAINIPLFDDSERKAVGTLYRTEGRRSAIMKGLELTAHSMTEKLRRAIECSASDSLLVHCWRGGMRSEAMAWLFSLGDIKTEILDGGYKSYRHYVLEKLGEKRNYIILGGLTGSGKTEILKKIKNQGHQVIDLEGIACHKGSAFGSLGQKSQPSSEHFSNILFSELSGLKTDEPVWLEDESKNIGSVFMPDLFWNRMQEAPLISLMMTVETRLPRLLKEYSPHNNGDLSAAVLRISKRLGGDRTKEAIDSIESGDFRRAIEITLEYYDKTYMYGIGRRGNNIMRMIETDTSDTDVNIRKILDAARDLSQSI